MKFDLFKSHSIENRSIFYIFEKCAKIWLSNPFLKNTFRTEIEVSNLKVLTIRATLINRINNYKTSEKNWFIPRHHDNWVEYFHVCLFLSFEKKEKNGCIWTKFSELSTWFIWKIVHSFSLKHFNLGMVNVFW